jgi:CubicO group peptidase (beta-lactamase class C family)
MDFETRVDEAIAKAISEGRIVGAVTIIAKDGDIIYRKAAGHFDREADKPMFAEAIFRLASVTKPLIAATALAMVERGLLGLDNAVSDHLPWFRPKLADGHEPKISIRHLLTHTSGLVYGDEAGVPGLTIGLQNTDMSLEETFTLWAQKVPLAFYPGTEWRYGPGIDVLGAVIEQIHSSKLHDAFHQYIARPLGMKDTGFAVTDPARLAVPYANAPPALRRMADPETVIDGKGARTIYSPGRIFNSKAFQSGGAGAVGTADDLILFFEAIRNRGVPILKPELVAQAIQNQIGDVPAPADRAGQRFGFLGAVVVDPQAADRPLSVGTNRWGGVYGHDWFIDFTKGLTTLTMTNTAKEGSSGMYPREVAQAIYRT